MNTRMRVGYMSQAFSLYEELSVRQNLVLQARLFRLPATQATERVNTMLKDFELTDHADERPTGLPLGYRQRLQLAAACITNPPPAWTQPPATCSGNTLSISRAMER
jgi:ribosome-dependent ATPase